MLEIFENGGPVMYPLLLCSIIVTTVIIERIIFWMILDTQRDQTLVDEVLELCRIGDWDSSPLTDESRIIIYVCKKRAYNQFP